MAKSGSSYRDVVAETVPERARSTAPLVPIAVVLLSEGALYTGRVTTALWGHLIALLVCVLVPLFVDDGSAFAAIGLLSLFRLINLGIPSFVDRTLYALPVIYTLLFPAIYITAARDNAPPVRESAKSLLVGFLPAIGLGVGLAEIEYRILDPQALVGALDITGTAAIVIVMFGFVGVAEELVYRGLLQPSLQRYAGRVLGVVVTAVLYGTMHSVYGSGLEILFGIGLGLVLGAIYELTDSITLVTVVHGTLNVFLYGVFPLRGPIVG
jgi:membrane protease YdiL (CAAX protease family)